MTKIPNEDFQRYRSNLRNRMWLAILNGFNKRNDEGITRAALADSLDISESVVSDILDGEAEMTMELFSDMARAMGFVPKITLVPREAGLTAASRMAARDLNGFFEAVKSYSKKKRGIKP